MVQDLKKILGQKSRMEVHLEPRISTMERRLIINVAPSGNVIRPKDYPFLPITEQQIAQEAIQSIKAGASIGHIHSARDEQGVPIETPEARKRVLDLIFEETDFVTSTHVVYDRSREGIDQFKPLIDSMYGYGRKYIQVCPTLLVSYTFGPGTVTINEETLEELVPYLEERGIKPEFQCFNLKTIEVVKKLIDNKIARSKPYFVNLHFGKYHTPPINIDPWSHNLLIVAIEYAHSMLPRQDTVLGVSVGGRNWLPITALGIALGVDVVRVGMEDTVWMYPHKDNLLEHNADAVRKVRTIGEALGREVASLEETRQILGISS